MPYLRVVPPLAGTFIEEANGEVVFTLDNASKSNHFFKSRGHYFVSEKIKDAIEDNHFTGLDFSTISCITKSGKQAKGCFYEVVAKANGGSTDFYKYDVNKMAVSEKVVSVLRKFKIDDLQFLDLNEATSSEKFYAEFEEKYDKGEL